MEDENSICVECKKVEKDASKLVTCMYCFTEAHYKCRNLIGNAARRIKDRMYFCSHNCSSIYQRIVQMQNQKSSIVEKLALELKGAVSNAVSQEMNNIRCEVQQVTAAIEKSQQFLSDKFDAMVTDVRELKRENVNLKLEVDELKHTQQVMYKNFHKLEHEVDRGARQAKCNNAVVFGVPYIPDENILEIVRKVIACYGLSVAADAIVSVERLGGKNKTVNSLIPIRVTFKDGNTKEAIFAKKKEIGKLLSSAINQDYVTNGRSSTVTMRDELTSLSLELLKAMREAQEKLQIKYVWASREGNILVKKTEQSKPEIIRSRNDLHDLINRYNKEVAEKQTPSPKRKCGINNNNL